MSDDQRSVSPTTTSEQDLRTAGQRAINLLWERTQAGIAIGVVGANIIYVFVVLFIAPPEHASSLDSASLLRNAFFLIVGFYFGRTNHARIGDDPRSISTRGGLDDR